MFARRKALAAALAFGFLLAGRTAHAEKGAYYLAYDTSVEGCPTPDRIRALVVARLGFDPFVEEAREATLRIGIAREDNGGLVARVGRESGAERVLRDRAGDCNELSASVALAASIVIDPTGRLAKQHEARSQPPPSASTTTAEDAFPSERPPPSPPPPSPEKLAAFIGVRTLGSVGLVPGVAAGFSVDGAVRFRRLVLRVEGRADLPVSSDPIADGSRVQASLLVGSLAPCYAAGAFQLCGVLSMGSFLIESENMAPVIRTQTFFAAAGIRPSLEVALTGPLRFIATAEGLVPFRRLTLTVRNSEVWTAPAVAASLGAGLLVQFM